MRVVYVCSLRTGGPVAHLQTLAPAVAAAGASVRVVCADERLATDFRNRGVEGVVVPMRHKLDLFALRRLWPHLARVDVVHTHDRRAGLLGRPTGRARAPVVVHTYHGLPEEIAVRLGRPDAPHPPGVSRARLAWLVHGYFRIEAALATLGTVVAPSRAMAAFLIEHGISPKRVRVLPHGIDLRRDEPNARHDLFRVATVARLEYWKGIDVLIAACARVATPLRLDVFGAGSQRERLERQAADLGVDARFHGWVDDPRECVEDTDLFVLPSRAENSPITILEAMAAAVPVVATRVGGVPELVEDGVSGIVVEPDSPAALANAIDRLASDDTARSALASAGAKRVASRFDPTTLGRRALMLYRGLAALVDGR